MIKPSILKDRTFKINRETGSPVPFCSPREKLSLGSLDEPKLTVVAHYNPGEFGVNKSMPWSSKLEQNDPKAMTRSTQDSHEYKGTPSRSMTLELLFDNYEKGTSVKPIIDVLETLSTVRDPESTDEEMRRPHFCIVSWGNGINVRCIITSLHIKFTMFSYDGTPLRAVCTMELQEANLTSLGARRADAVAQSATEAVRSLGRAASAVAGLFRG